MNSVVAATPPASRHRPPLTGSGNRPIVSFATTRPARAPEGGQGRCGLEDSRPEKGRITVHAALNIDLAVTRRGSAACTSCLNWPQLMASAVGVG
jgi:hypothetical protein